MDPIAPQDAGLQDDNKHTMKISITNPKSHSRNLFRRAGYALHQGRDGEVSYTRRLSGGGDYPRFHVYVNAEELGELIEFSLHLDEKQPSYEGFTAHSGQYDGPLVEEERDRLLGLMGGYNVNSKKTIM